MLNEAASDFPPQLLGKAGEPIARLNLTLCFFGKTRAAPWCDAGLAALKAWADRAPTSALDWMALGASATQFSKGGAGALGKCVKQIEAGRARDGSLNAASLRGPQRFGADYSFRWTYVSEASDPDAEQTNYLELQFPPQMLEQEGPDSFAKWALDVAASTPFDSGYSALSWGPVKESSELEAGKSLGALALRHPGFDVAINRTVHFDIGSHCRGAQWLVFLSPTLAARVGGVPALVSAVPYGSVQTVGTGHMIRASDRPELGDVNRNRPVRSLGALARVLEPISYFGDYALDVLFNEDEELRERWERRFLPS